MYDFVKNFLGKSASPKKNGFDLSNNEAFHQPFGVEQPVKRIFTVPNEFYDVKVKGYTQTAPMREDNFATIKQELRAVFVPLSSLMRDYLGITSADRNTRKDESIFRPAQFVFKLRDVLQFCSYLYNWNKIAQWITSFNYYHDVYIKNVNSVKQWVNGSDVPLTTVYANTKYYNYAVALNAITSASTLAGGKKLDEIIPLLSEFVNPFSKQLMCFDIIRLLDALNYGNYLPYLDDIFQNFLKNNHWGEYSIVNISTGYNIKFIPDEESNWYPDVDLVLDLFPLFAYQYYINVARRSNYRSPASFLITPDAILAHFNGDVGHQGFEFDAGDTNYTTCTFGLVHNAPYFSKEFKKSASNLQAAIFSSSHMPFDTYCLNGYFSTFIYLFGLSNPLLDSDVFTSSQLTVVSGSIPTTSTADLVANPVQTINDMQALYKLRQDLLRAGIRRDKQMESIFGVGGNQHVYESIKVLDVSSNNIKTDPVCSFAETEEMALGERGARGNGSSGLSFKFKSEDYGYLFITSVFTADLFYESFGIDRQHTLSSKSWFLPQMANLGLEPIRQQAVSIIKADSSEYGNGTIYHDVNRTRTIGFSSHDWHLKSAVDIAHGLFTQFAFNTAENYDAYGRDNSHTFASLSRGNAMFGGFVPTLITQQVKGFSDALDLYYSPDMVNNLFIQLVDFYIHNDPSFDYFKCAVHYEIHKTSPMPKLGLLSLNV